MFFISLSEQGFVHQLNQESLTGYFKRSHPCGECVDVHVSVVSSFIPSDTSCSYTQRAYSHTHNLVLFFSSEIYIAPKPKRDDHAIEATSPYETNVHPNRMQKQTRVYRYNFVVGVFKLDQNFCYPKPSGGKKRRKSISLWTKTSSAVLYLDLPEVGRFYIFYFFQNGNKLPC